MRRIGFPGDRATSREREIVTRQIGRDPRGAVAIAARCEYGLPAVIRTAPRLADGSPYPTLYYLVCPMAVRAIGRLEASGAMRDYEERVTTDEALRDEYERAHERYLTQRDSIEALDEPMSAGGMPSRVKCLHALYAHEVADGNPVGALARAAVEPLGCPGPCVEAGEGGAQERVGGHPGFGGKKRRR